MAVTDPGTELTVVTSCPRGDPMAFVTGWISSAGIWSVGLFSADAGARNRVRTGPAVGFDPVVALSAAVALSEPTATSESTTSASEETADCVASDTTPSAGVLLDPLEKFDPGSVDAPAGWANKADRAKTAKKAPRTPKTNVTGRGHQRNRTGSSVWSSRSCANWLPRFAP